MSPRIGGLPAALLDRLGLARRPVVRRVLLMSGSAVFGQALSVVASPVLARLYGPEDYGALAVFGAAVALLVTIASLRYDLAIPIAETDEEGANVLGLALAVAVGTAAISAVLVYGLGGRLIAATSTPALAGYLWFVPVAVLGLGLYAPLSYWGYRRKAFGRLAVKNVLQSVTRVGTQLGLGFTGFGGGGLILGMVAGSIAGTGSLAKQIWTADGSLLWSVTLRGMAAAARKFRRFPLFSTASGLLYRAGLETPALLLAALYGPRAAGLFALGRRVVGLPMNLVGSSVAQVYHAEAAALLHTDPEAAQRLFRKTIRHAAVVVAGPLVILTFTGPWLFGVVFGSRWLEAGEFVRALALMFFFEALAVPVSAGLNILQRLNLQLGFDVAKFLLGGGALVASYLLGGSALTAVTMYSVGMAVAHIINLYLNAVEIRKLAARRPPAPGTPANDVA